MPVCPDCSEDFDLLQPNLTCNKCRELQGKSAVEKTAIKEKGQCRTCSLVYANLDEALCKACCNHYKHADAVPQAVLQIAGVMKQLDGYNQSNSGAEILSIASGYQDKASQSRIGLPRTQNTSLQKTVTSRFGKPGPGISKGKALIAEMKSAKDNANKIKISACLYLSKKGKNGSDTVSKIQQVNFSLRFGEEIPIFDALGSMVKDAKEFHQKSFPLANPINRQMVSFFAHESASKAMRLNDRVTTEGTVGAFLEEFFEQGYISKTAKEKKSIEIRIVCEEARLFPSIVDGNEDDDFYMMDPSMVKSNAKSSSSATRSAKRKLSSAAAPRPHESGPRNVRRSAWPAPKARAQYTWDLEMTLCTFTRTTAELCGPKVTFIPSSFSETIEIAPNWHAGWECSVQQKNFEGSGYIGCGSAKRVIYARFGGKEYALGQGFNKDISNDDNTTMLKAEFENLIQGEAFRATFEDLGLECSTVIPRFRFNLEDAILGTFVLNDDCQDPPAGLPFLDFIATRLLPCSAIDAPIQKFTGNDDAGTPPTNAPGEAMTMALHAFTHYVILLSRANLVLCDLQGMCDKGGTMTLIDPQSHSSEPDSNKRPYWDSGPKAIERYLTHHLKVCSQNVICSALRLRSIEVEGQSDDENAPPSPYKARPVRHPKTSNQEPIFVAGDSDDDDLSFVIAKSFVKSSAGPSSRASKSQPSRGRTGPLRTGWDNQS